MNCDDNDEILEMLKARLTLGRERYGHGVRVEDDTTQWGTEKNDWELMAIEEVMDGLIYSAAAIIRLQRKREEQSQNKFNNSESLINAIEQILLGKDKFVYNIVNKISTSL